MIYTGKEFAENAMSPKWDKFSYSQLDCQGFVEAVLKDMDIRKKDGTLFNWRGSNSMYRNFYTWHGLIEDCKKKFGDVPSGAFVYMWEASGESELGYSDGLGNFKHVGIYCGNNVVRDSTRSTKTGRNGVGTRTLSGFTYCSLFSYLDYSLDKQYNASVERVISSIDIIRNELIKMEESLNELFRG